MKSILILIALCFSATSAFATEIELPSMDVLSVAEQIANKVALQEFGYATNAPSEKAAELVTYFLQNMSKMSCLAETSASPMKFLCTMKDVSVLFKLRATGNVVIDNGQVVGVQLDKSVATLSMIVTK